MKPSRPSAIVTVDGDSFTAAEGALVSLEVELGLAPAHDRVEMVLWPSSKLASAAPGAALEIAIGEAGDEEDVWSGEVSAVAAEPDGLILEGLAKTVALSRAWRSQTFVGQSVDAIVRDLAADADIDRVEADTQLDAYSVDDRRSVWEHLVALARLAGCEVSTSPAGGLRFTPADATGPSQTLRYGADLVRWSTGAMSVPAKAVATAYGAASEKGADKWHWLRHEPVASPGDTPTRIVAFHNHDAADALSQAYAGRAARAGVGGTVTTIGMPTLRPGDALTLEDLPAPDPGGLRVVRVEHLFDTGRGFWTTLTVESGATGGLAGLAGAIGL